MFRQLVFFFIVTIAGFITGCNTIQHRNLMQQHISTLNTSSNVEERRNAVFQLSTYNNIDKSVLPHLVQSSQDDDVIVREYTIKTVGKMDPHFEEVIEVLKTGLRDSSIAVRRASAAIFSTITPVPTALLIPLTACLDDQDSLLSSFAKTMFVDLGALSVNALVHACKNSNEVLRCNAVTLLGEIGSDAKMALTTLENLLDDENEQVRNAASQSILKIKNGYSHKNKG